MDQVLWGCVFYAMALGYFWASCPVFPTGGWGTIEM
jgi:hypothetical protein